MAELRGLHAPLAAFLHIIATSRLLEVLHDDNRAIVRAASHASKAADYLLGFLPEMAEDASTESGGVDQEAA